MNLLPENAALIVVDVQKGMDDPALGRRNNPEAETNIARLLEAWRRTKRPVFHVQHLSVRPDSPFRPGQSGVELKDGMGPRGDEPLIQKRANCAFIDTDLEAQLRFRNIETVVIAGMTTDHCVSATTRVSGDLGFRTYLVGDATATFDRLGSDGAIHPAETVHAVSLASLHGEFATVIGTESLLSRLEEGARAV